MLDMNAQEFNFDEEVFRVDPISSKDFFRNSLLSLAKDVYGMFHNRKHHHRVLSGSSPLKKKSKTPLQQAGAEKGAEVARGR